MTKISLCMIAKDEEHYLETCLSNLKGFVSEIIVVVDSRSTDKTKKIAEMHGAKTKVFEWCDDFAAARNESLKMATGDWILVMDADEELSVEAKEKIQRIVHDPRYAKEEIIGFKFDQRTYNLADRSKYTPYKNRHDMTNYSGYKSNKLVRLFKNHPKIRFNHRVHEVVEDSIRENAGMIVDEEIILHHYAALKGMEFYLDKIKNYTEIMVQQLQDDPDNVRYLWQAGNIFFDNHEIDLAMKYYKRVAKKNPNYQLIFSDIARCHLVKGNITEAIKGYNLSMKLKPEDPSAANNLAVLYMKLGKHETAQSILTTYAPKFPDYPALQHNLQRVQRFLEKK